MLGRFTTTGLPNASFYVRMAMFLIAGLALVVVSIVLFVAGQPSGVAALMFGVIFLWFGGFSVWLAIHLHREADQRAPTEAAEPKS